MKQASIIRVLTILLLSASAIFLLPPSLNPSLVHATNARLEVWSPVLRSSNITSLDPSFQPGNTFIVRVNVTGAGPLLGFDVTLHYNITVGPNVLQAIHPQVPDPLSGGLFDPAANPSNCNIAAAKSDVDIPGGRIRYAAVTQSGCTEPGSGTLFSITFKVQGVGATSIDVIQVASTIVGGVGTPPRTTVVPFDRFNAYFRNKAGIPPSPNFTYTPTSPLQGDSVLFNATTSRDSDNPSAPNGGAQADPLIYDTNNNQMFDAGDLVILGQAPPANSLLGSPPPYPGCRVGCMFDQPDPHVAYVDSNHSGHWNAGETIIYDTNENGKFDQGDFVITGSVPTIGTTLASDPQLTFYDAHRTGFWDNGYIWDWGDGSTVLSTGNVTGHVFQSAPTITTKGKFEVKLVEFDADTGLPNEKTQLVGVGTNVVWDVSAYVTLSKPTATVGDKLGVAVTITNIGTEPINATYHGIIWALANMSVTFDYNTVTLIGSQTGIALPTLGSSKTYNYTIDTSPLTPRTYTVTVQAQIVNSTTQQVIPNASPDNVRTVNFVLQGVQPPTVLSLPIILAGGAGAVVVVAAVVYLLRRRRPVEE